MIWSISDKSASRARETIDRMVSLLSQSNCRHLVGFFLSMLMLAGNSVSAIAQEAQSLDQGGEQSSWSYTMRPGDTLWSVCTRFSYYENCWRELGSYNKISKDKTIAVGQRIEMPVSWLQAPLVSASVRHLSGPLTVIRDNAELNTISVGDVIQIGDRLLLADGELVIEFSDGSLLTLSPNSELIVDAITAIKQTRQSDIQVSLPTGSAKIRVKRTEPRNRFRVRTTTGVAAVRGTEFRVRNDETSPVTRTEVLEGSVDYSASGAVVELDSGFATLAEYGEPPIEPVALLDSPAWLPQCNIPSLVEWEALAGADYYLLDLLEEGDAQGGEAIDRVLSRHRTEKNYYEFSGVAPGCYRLRVKGVQNGFIGLESERRYCVPDSLDQPLVSLAQLDKHSVLSVEFDPVIGAESYVLEFSKTADFSRVSQTIVVDEAGLTQRVDQVPAEYGFVRARAVSETAASSYSDTQAVKHLGDNGVVWTVIGIIFLFVLI